MARITAHLSGIELALVNRWAEANAAAALNSLRMSAQQKILTPADDPATFFALSQLQYQLNNVTNAMDSVTTVQGIVSQTQTTIDQIISQLETIQSLLQQDEDGGLTPEQRAEAQQSIDQALDQINQLIHTQINGQTLLAGSADYMASGVDSSQISRLWVQSVPLSGSFTIIGEVTAAATQAQLTYSGSSGQVANDASFTLSGSRGSASFSVTAGESLSDVADRINAESHNTGVTASVNGNQLIFTSVDYGSAAEVSVTVTSGTFTVSGGDGNGTATGTDAEVQINGLGNGDAGLTVNGNTVVYNKNGLRFQIELQPGFVGALDRINVEQGGLTFLLGTNPVRQLSFSLPALSLGTLGGPSGHLEDLATGGSLAGLGSNTSQALRVVDEALGQLRAVKGYVDGFYNSAVSTASSLLSEMQQDLQDTISAVDGYNEQEESLLLSKNQQLAENALAALSILNQQRQSIVNLLKQIAGID